MSSVKSSSSAGDSAWKELERHDGRGGEIMKMGYLKKLKTMKKKFFVLRGESAEASARLEYYDSEKKYRSHHSPKRTIALKTCFNINRRTDTKQKYVIALYTKDDCFCLVLESEEELEEWLNGLLSLQHGEDVPDGEPPKPIFEHVWQVTVEKKGLGNSKHILGPFLLCLTEKTLSLVSKSQEEKPDTYEFSLMSIRRCGHSDCFFYMEVGRSACTGAGDLWMQTEDPNIAQNMHAAILGAMSNNSSKEAAGEVGQRSRTRSTSVIEASKPIMMIPHKTSHLGVKAPSYSTSDDIARATVHTNFAPNRIQSTLPYIEHPSVSPSTSDVINNQVCVGSLPGSYHCHHTHQRVAPTHHPPVPTTAVRPSQRRHSVSAMCVSSVGGSGSTATTSYNSITTTTTTVTTSALWGVPTHQRTYSFPLSEPSSGCHAAVTPSVPPSWDGRRASTGRPASGKRTSASSSRSSTAAGRERCDSLPSRARTTSEGHPQAPPHALPTPTSRGAHLVPGHQGCHVSMVRPHSMYTRGVSYSPPVGSSPVSPASGACSTDSAGSSLSIDDPGENWIEEGIMGMGRYGTSLGTPDEPAIIEEGEYWPGPGCGSVSDGNYMKMDRIQPSLSLPIQSSAVVTTVTAPYRKISPNLSSSGVGLSSQVSGSPSQGSYMDVYSPCGSSPMENTGYMTMSPGGGSGSAPLEPTPRMQIYPRAANSANHSRGSSLAEDGYVPMGPTLTDDGYVDMDPMNPSHSHEHFHHSEMSPASSCSITSGTPSTDLRFSEYHLEKVSSYFTPSEEDETSSLDRPIPRAYSVGSRPENLKKPTRLENQNQATDQVNRVRAFSVGSRCPLGGKGTAIPGRSSMHDPASGPRVLSSVMGTTTLTPPGHSHLLHAAMTPTVPVASSKKSVSAPLLSNSWSGSGSSSLRHGPHSSHSSVEPMDDLMEMDFTRTPRSSSKNSFSKAVRGKGSGDSALPPHHSSPLSEKSGVGTPSGYVDMSARSVSSTPKSHTPTSGPYLEMKPALPDSVSASPPHSHAMSKSPKSSVHSGPYVDMKPGLPSDTTRTESRTASISISVPSKVSGTSVSPKAHGPYVDMRPSSGLSDCQRKTSTSVSPPMRPTVITSNNAVTSKSFASEELPYVPMKPSVISSESSSSFTHTAPILVPTSSSPYVDMKPGSVGEYQSQNTPPANPLRSNTTPTNVSPKSYNVGPYVEMTPSGFPASSSFSRQSTRKPASPIQEEYVDMSLKPVRKTSRQETSTTVTASTVVNRTAPVDTPQPKKPPDGYVEMSWNRGSKSSPKSSLEDYKSPPGSSQDDYMNMSFEGRGSLGKKRRSSRKEKGRYSSQPIAISGAPKESAAKTSSASTSPVFLFTGRKSSTGTPPKVPPAYLPLSGGSAGAPSPSGSPFSSLRRTRKTGSAGIDSRRESGDGSSGLASGLTTPTGSTTIFPLSLNSPGSPMKPFPGSASPAGAPAPAASATKPGTLHTAPGSETEARHKCPVDATSGTVRISYPYEMHMSQTSTGSTPATPDSSSSSEQPTPVNSDPVDDIMKSDEPDNHDYVNFCPRKTSEAGRFSKKDDFGDYAVMRPVAVVRATEPARKISAPSYGATNRRFNNVHSGVASLTISSPTPNNSKSTAASQESLLSAVRKTSLNYPLPSPATVPEAMNGPKVVTAGEKPSSTSLSRQSSNASTKSSKGRQQLSRSSSGSSEVGRASALGSTVTLAALEDKSECLSVKSEDSGTISPASSQTAVASRPPSVSSERELHYASLDLAPSGSEGEDGGARSPRALKTQGSLTESSNSSPSPNPSHGAASQGGPGGDAFTYAEIDFSRRDAHAHAPAPAPSPSSGKVKQ